MVTADGVHSPGSELLKKLKIPLQKLNTFFAFGGLPLCSGQLQFCSFFIWTVPHPVRYCTAVHCSAWPAETRGMYSTVPAQYACTLVLTLVCGLPKICKGSKRYLCAKIVILYFALDAARSCDSSCFSVVFKKFPDLGASSSINFNVHGNVMLLSLQLGQSQNLMME